MAGANVFEFDGVVELLHRTFLLQVHPPIEKTVSATQIDINAFFLEFKHTVISNYIIFEFFSFDIECILLKIVSAVIVVDKLEDCI